MNAIDIETVPNKALVDFLPEPEYKYGNTKDPEKRAVIEENAKIRQVERMALSPYFGKICSVAWCDRDLSGNYIVVDKVDDANEINIIKECFSLMTPKQYNDPTIVTFNGYRFDVPYIFVRAMLLKIEIPRALLTLKEYNKRYQHVPHCDVAMEACAWNTNEYVSLNTICACHGLEGKKSIDVTTFLDMVEEGKQGEIGTYNLQDVEQTMKIYNNMEKYIF